MSKIEATDKLSLDVQVKTFLGQLQFVNDTYSSLILTIVGSCLVMMVLGLYLCISFVLQIVGGRFGSHFGENTAMRITSLLFVAGYALTACCEVLSLTNITGYVYSNVSFFPL